jgi:hypothetical protein
MHGDAVRRQASADKAQALGIVNHNDRDAVGGVIDRLSSRQRVACDVRAARAPAQRAPVGACLLQVCQLAAVEAVGALHLALQRWGG